MFSKLSRFKKFKYSSLLNFTIKGQKLRIKGPLGINYIGIPETVFVSLNDQKNVFYISLHPGVSLKQKHSYLTSISSAIISSSRSLIFGDMTFLNLEGLGFKFVSVVKAQGINLEMSLGYSTNVYYLSNFKRIRFYIKSPRNLYIYSSDYSVLQNESFSILNLKKPDKYKNKGFSIKKFI